MKPVSNDLKKSAMSIIMFASIIRRNWALALPPMDLISFYPSQHDLVEKLLYGRLVHCVIVGKQCLNHCPCQLSPRAQANRWSRHCINCFSFQVQTILEEMEQNFSAMNDKIMAQMALMDTRSGNNITQHISTTFVHEWSLLWSKTLNVICPSIPSNY